MDQTRIVEVKRIRSQRQDCEICRIDVATRVMETQIREGEPFELYRLCDNPECVAKLQELV